MIIISLISRLQSFFFIIGTITLLSLLGFGLRKLIQFVMVVKQRRRAQTEYIVREICRILSESSQKDRPFVVLSQLRDKIIAPSKQAELKSAWDEAVNYIRQNDSRIHFGVDMVNGESVKGFRWIEDVAAPTSASKSSAQFANQQKTPALTRSSAFPIQNDQVYATVKKWRCSAFDHSNKIKDPPTNCLKIRQMVSYNSWFFMESRLFVRSLTNTKPIPRIFKHSFRIRFCTSSKTRTAKSTTSNST